MALKFCNFQTTYNAENFCKSYRNFFFKCLHILLAQFKVFENDIIFRDGLPSDEKIEEMLDEGNSNMFAASILDQTKIAQNNLLELQTRHGEFMKVHFSIFLKEVENLKIFLFLSIA